MVSACASLSCAEERIARYKSFKEFQKRIMVSTDLFGRASDVCVRGARPPKVPPVAAEGSGGTRGRVLDRWAVRLSAASAPT